MIIRAATQEDLPRYAELVAEMDRHYGAVVDTDLIRQRLQERFAEYSDLVFLVAEENGALLGHATMSPVFPAGHANAAYFVKDIFVREGARGRGIGEALLRACAAEARKRGAPRLDLTVDGNNREAARLYARLGAVDTNKRYLRWDGESLDTLMGKPENG